MKIAVLTGGASDEREVSLATGVEVAAALREAGHEVLAVDTAAGVMSEEEEGRIREEGVPRVPSGEAGRDLLTTGDTSLLTDDPGIAGSELFFVALHGGAGEDGTLQALLDLLGVPYTGSGLLGCALAMDKDVSKRLFRDAGIPTPEWMTWHPERVSGDTGAPSPERSEGPSAAEIVELLGLPVIVKAAGGGSSVRLIVAHDEKEVESAIREARDFDDVVVVERFVRGREYTVGVLGDEALPVGEIVAEHEIFDYECKYQPGMAREIFPAELPPETGRKLQRLALEVHHLLRMDDYSRADFIVDAEGRPWCLEANALPGMTSNSLIPKAARAAGISFPELCDRIAGSALARRAGGT